MRVRLDDREGNFAADWCLSLRTDETGRAYVEWVERQVRGGVECLSAERALDLFSLLSTRSRPVSEKVTIFRPAK